MHDGTVIATTSSKKALWSDGGAESWCRALLKKRAENWTKRAKDLVSELASAQRRAANYSVCCDSLREAEGR